MLERLGIDEAEELENYTPQLLAQPPAMPPHAAAAALPFEGNLRPDRLLPVVVQPQLIHSATYTSPHTGAARGRSNPVVARMLRGRGGP